MKIYCEEHERRIKEVEQFEEEFKRVYRMNGVLHIRWPKYSWTKFCLICPVCRGVLKVRRISRRYGCEKIIEFAHKHFAGNKDQLFECCCGYKYAQTHSWSVTSEG